jgi:hypothetical protein
MRFYFKFIVIITLILSIVAGATTAIVYYYQDDIEQIVINELNKVLIHPLEIEDVEISVLNSFPYTSIDLKNIKAIDGFGKDTLLEVENLSLAFNVIDLYNKDYNIQEVVLKNGSASIYYSNGKPNYQIWKIKNDSSSSANTNLSLNNILLKNFKIEFTNENDIKSIVTNKNTKLQLGINQGVTQILIEADIINEELILNDLNLLTNKEIELKSTILVDSIGQSISLLFDTEHLNFTSDIINNNENLLVELKTETIDIEQIVKIIPKQFATYIKNYKAKGSTKVNLNYNRKKNQDPILKIEFDANNFSGHYLDYKLSDATFSGSFNDNTKQNKIEINALKALLNNNLFEAEINIDNLDNPNLKIDLNTKIELSNLDKFNIKIPFHLLQGNAKINLKYDGKIGLKNKYQLDIAMAEKEAKVVLKNIVLQQKPNSLKLYNGFANLKLINEQLITDSVSFKMAQKSDIRFNGAFDNIFKYLFLKNAPLRIAGKLDSDWILVDELINTDSTINEGQEKQKINFPKNIIGSLKVNFTDLSYDKFHMRNFSTDLTYNNQLLKAKNIFLESMSGNIESNLSIQQLENKNIRLISSSQMNQINVRQLFYEFHNFGQKTMRHKHLRGTISSEIYFRNEWDPYFNTLDDRMYSFIDLKIEDGQLLDFEPLTMMSDYIALSELKRIKFSTLENQIEIKEGKIEIPFMEIYSSATDIAISGTHTFENEMDYDIKVLLNEILSNKFKRKNKKKKTNEFGVIEDDGVKGLTFFLKMSGTVDNPKITPGTIKLRESLKEGFKKEKKEFKNILKKEFNKNKSNEQEVENTDYNNLIEWEE